MSKPESTNNEELDFVLISHSATSCAMEPVRDQQMSGIRKIIYVRKYIREKAKRKVDEYRVSGVGCGDLVVYAMDRETMGNEFGQALPVTPFRG